MQQSCCRRAARNTPAAMKVEVIVLLLLPLARAEPFFDNLMELPLNMAGFMSVDRASTECEEQVRQECGVNLFT